MFTLSTHFTAYRWDGWDHFSSLPIFSCLILLPGSRLLSCSGHLLFPRTAYSDEDSWADARSLRMSVGDVNTWVSFSVHSLYVYLPWHDCYTGLMCEYTSFCSQPWQIMQSNHWPRIVFIPAGTCTVIWDLNSWVFYWLLHCVYEYMVPLNTRWLQLQNMSARHSTIRMIHVCCVFIIIIMTVIIFYYYYYYCCWLLLAILLFITHNNNTQNKNIIIIISCNF